MRLLKPIVLCAFLSASGGWAFEGKLPVEQMEKLNGEQWSLTLGGVTAVDVVKEINKLKSYRVGIDPKLAGAKVAKYEIKGETILGAADRLTKIIGGKTYLIRDFAYITKELPPNVSITGQPPKPNAQPACTLPALFPGLKAGSSKKMSWQRKSVEQCREDARPIVLLIIGDAEVPKGQKPPENKDDRDSPQAAMLEIMLLEDEAVLKALSEFSFVKIYAADPADWPGALLERARHSGAVLLLTGDCLVQAGWSDNNVRPQVIVDAAAKTLAANEAVRKRLGKTVAVKKEEKKEPDKPSIPGLANKGDEKKEPPKKEEGKKEEGKKEEGKKEEGKKETGKKETGKTNNPEDE